MTSAIARRRPRAGGRTGGLRGRTRAASTGSCSGSRRSRSRRCWRSVGAAGSASARRSSTSALPQTSRRRRRRIRRCASTRRRALERLAGASTAAGRGRLGRPTEIPGRAGSRPIRGATGSSSSPDRAFAPRVERATHGPASTTAGTKPARADVYEIDRYRDSGTPECPWGRWAVAATAGSRVRPEAPAAPRARAEPAR